MSDGAKHVTDRPVALGVAPGDPRIDRIRDIAAGMRVSLVEGTPAGGRTTVGSTSLPPVPDRSANPVDDPAARVGDDDTPDATPDWFIEAAILRALEPRHILFLCVANSARSQLAEGIARSLAQGVVTEGIVTKGSASHGTRIPVKISSAGSVPTSVRPQAIEVLREIDIDISHHRSDGIDDVEGPVDVVITLCAEEVCPVWLEDSIRVHWGLPDPAGAGGSDEEELQAFRDTRDELLRRLGVLFTGRPV